MNTNINERTKWTVQKGVRSFAAGSTAGIISTVGLQPLEVIKTHMQARDGPRGHSIGGAIVTISEKDGVRGFWRGSGPACVRVGLGAGLYFALLSPILSVLQRAPGIYSAHTTHSMADPLKEKLPASITASAGALARLLASTMTCPITVVKTRMEYAAASNLHYGGTVSALITIARTEGLTALYKGVWPTLVRDAPYSGLYLVLYTRMRQILRDNFSPTRTPHLYINFLSGAMSGGLATFLTHPPEVVRTRLQLHSGEHRMGMLSTARQIVQSEGLRGLLVGVVPRIGRRGLQMAISWAVYEELDRHLNQKQ